MPLFSAVIPKDSAEVVCPARSRRERLRTTRDRAALLSALLPIFLAALAGCEGCSPHGNGRSGPSAAPSQGAPDLDPRLNSVVALPSSRAALTDEQAEALVRGNEVRLALTSEGAEPRELLRYAPDVGQKDTLGVEFDVDTTIVRGAHATATVIPVPRLRMRLDTSVANSEPNDEELDFTVKLTELAAVVAVPEEEEPASRIAPILARMTGMEAPWFVDPRGVAVKHPSPAKDPEAFQIFSSLVETMHDILVPLPTVRLGEGATWSAMWRLDRGGFSMVRRVDYTLTESDGSRVVIDASVRERAVNSHGDDGKFAEPIEVDVLSGAATGALRLELARGQIAPVRVTGSLDSELQILANGPPGSTNEAGESRERSTLKLRQRLTIINARAPEVPAAGSAADVPSPTPSASVAPSAVPEGEADDTSGAKPGAPTEGRR